MNSESAKVLYKLGARLRNPSLSEKYDYLKSTEWLSRSELLEVQLENAKSFLGFVERNSPYYKSIFQKIGFSASSLSSISDIKIIPEISKSELIENNSSIHSSSNSEKLMRAETSGTSGVSLEFLRNESWDSLNRAALMRSYDWYDVRPWDRNGYLWGYNIEKIKSYKTRLTDALQNRFRLFDYSRAGIESFCFKLCDARFVSGYSSMIYEVAKTINSYGIQVPEMRLVKGTSEMILDVYHDEVKKAFGRKMVSEYGAAEAGLIAFECPEGSQHINIENLLVETNNDEEILVTNLSSRSFPIIRYNLGDVVDLDFDSACPCGRKHPIIKNIRGRRGLSVVGVSGNKYPGLTFYYVFKNIALDKGVLLNYKAEQNEPGSVVIYIEGEKNRKFEGYVLAELKKYFSEDVVCNISYVDCFDFGGKKRQYFSSSI